MSVEETIESRPAPTGWAWASLLPLGLGAWAPVVPGVRHRQLAWTVLGVFWSVVVAGGWGAAIAAPTNTSDHNQSALAGGLILLGWAGAIATSFAIRSGVRRGSYAVAASSTPTPGVPQPVRYEFVRPPRTHRDRWPWISVIPLGLGSWAPLVAAGRCRNRLWASFGIAGLLSCILGFVLVEAANRPGYVDSSEAAVGSGLLFAAWAGGVIASFEIRPIYDRHTGFEVPPTPWPKPTARSLAWSARYSVIAYVLTFVFVVLLALVLDLVFNLHTISVGYGVLMVDATLLCGLIPLARRRGLSFTDLGIRRTSAMPSLGLVIQALGVYLALAVLYSVAFIGNSTQKQANQLSSEINQLHGVPLVVAIVAISISAPVVEEVFFRGLLYRGLRNRLSVWPAALIAGVMFGFVHITGYPLVTLPVKALFGVIACLLYERTGSLLPGMALHSFVDASGVDVAVTGNDWIVLCIAGVISIVILVNAVVQKPGTNSQPPLSPAPG